MKARLIGLAVACGVLLGVAAPAANALTVNVGTKNNEVLVSCTSVSEAGLYSWVTVLGTTILVKPGGPCPVPPDIS